MNDAGLAAKLMLAALAALAAGAVAGIFLAARHFRRKRLPVTAALLHGLGGATGFTLVLLLVVREPAFGLARQALYLFSATILLGVVNLLFHVRKVRHRTSLILMHAMAAVSGVGTLAYAVLVHPPAPAPALVAEAPAPATEAPPPPVAAEAPPPVDAEPTAASGAPASEEELTIEPSVRRALARRIAFATSSAELLRRSSLDAIAAVLRYHPEIALVEVQGHADARGDDQQNVELTRARAEAVVDGLVMRGVERERLRAAGYGARCPAEPSCRGGDHGRKCQGRGHWRRDRRVVLVPLRVGSASFRGELVCERGASLIPSEHLSFHAAGKGR